MVEAVAVLSVGPSRPEGF